MIVRDALRAYALSLPEGTTLPVAREIVLELLDGAGSCSAGANAVPPADLAVPELATRYRRSPSTIRTWCEQGRFLQAYRLNGREWRVPVTGVLAFDAAARDASATSTPRTAPPPSAAAPRRRGAVDLGAWRRERKDEETR